MKRILKKTTRGCLLGICIGMLWCASAHALATVMHIDMDSAPGTLQIALSQRTSFKVMQLDAREIMVAFKSADLAPKIAGSSPGRGMVKQVTIEKLPEQVVSVKIDTTADLRDVQAEWLENSGTLLVRFVTTDPPPEKTVPVKRRIYKKGPLAGAGQTHATDGAESPEALPTPDPDPVEAPLRTEADTLRLKALPGEASMPATEARMRLPEQEVGLDAFVPEMSRGECTQSPVLAEALAACRKKEWEKSFSLLSVGLDPGSSDACQADLYYLRAFAAFKMNTAGSARGPLDAVNYFQDALSYFPESPYAPYALLVLATIYDDLENFVEAKGYYNLLLKTYADHPVAAEAMFSLAKLYAGQQQQELAISTFRQYMAAYPISPRLSKVRLELGKSLYELNEFAEALAMLTRVTSEDPRCIYEDPDLLIYLGNLNYQLGNAEKAREVMIQAVNLFPRSEVVPVMLTRIGDTLKDGGRPDPAKKIYELVMETYPGTDGFAISAIRYADLLSERSDKEAQYRMIIDRLPGHPMAKLAVVKLADLQSRAGEYRAGIDTLRELIQGDLKDLKNEAEYVMASCFDGYFKELAGQDNPLAVITAYEKDRYFINRVENPDIFEVIGTAFFQTNFYTQAEELFQKSYKASASGKRSVSLYYRLAMTLQELGKNMQAMEMFRIYFQKIPKDRKDPEAFLRMGKLLAAEGSWDSALDFLKTGFRQSESDMEKAECLTAQAEVYQASGKVDAVPDLLVRAINLMASSPEVSNERLMQVHRVLGESYMTLSVFDKASDAYTMAVKFSGESRPPDLLFLLAEANLKAQKPEAARVVFSEIVGGGDDFWRRMAQERLRTMELADKLERQG